MIKAAVETERPETVSFGDSMSMRDGHHRMAARRRKVQAAGRIRPAMTYRAAEIRRQALMSDLSSRA
ncbi:MAG: hypothetical protein ACLRMJ_00830 [Alistipes finegoldii]